MDEQTVETYNKRSKEYDDETTLFWEKFPSTFIDTFIQNHPTIVLDIGSGPGRDALLLKERGTEVICVDASEAMLKLTQAKGFESIKGDLLSLPFNNETFTHVWAYTSLLHVSKKRIEKALYEVKRVLTSNGVFALGMIEGEGESYKESSGVDLPRLFSYYQKKELEALLNRCGFEIVYFDTYQPRSKKYLNFIAKKIS